MVVTMVMIAFYCYGRPKAVMPMEGFRPGKFWLAMHGSHPGGGGKFLGLASIRTARLPKFLRVQNEKLFLWVSPYGK